MKKRTTEALPLYLTPEQKRKLRRMAQAEDRHMAAVVRRLIDEAPDTTLIDLKVDDVIQCAAKLPVRSTSGISQYIINIKAVRLLVPGVSLKEAKDWVDLNMPRDPAHKRGEV